MKETSKAPMAGRFGTFGGVFTPCVLTILGVIMFLRFGQVVGQAGLVQVTVIVCVATAITTLTAFSLSAIATNTRVQGGGAYFLISRSLGEEFGGAIGVVFYLAQAVSVALYVIGFTEAFRDAFPAIGWNATAIASVVNLAVFASVYIGAGWTIRLQYAILAVLVLSLLSFAAGALPALSPERLHAQLGADYAAGSGFFVMFALFFPAVTGIMAGANMSGDLRDPGRSIPAGTLAAIAATTLVYLGMALMLAGAVGRAQLLGDNFVVGTLARWPVLVTAGVFAATLSSALGSMMGAPRILQALARDRIFPRLRPFGHGTGRAGEPRRATVLTALVAQAGIMFGTLDAIAPIITMFFMITYGTLNLACFYEAYTGNPSFRPMFRLSHWSVGLAGALGCMAVMFLMTPLWALAAILTMAALHWYVGRAEVEGRWGDVQSGIAYERARRALLRLEEERYHPKNWRPTVLALCQGKWHKDFRVAEYGHWLTAGHGVITYGQVIGGEVEDHLARRQREETGLREFIRREELEAFPVVVVEPDLLEGTKSLLQSNGIGGLRPNTLLLPWRDAGEEVEVLGAQMRLIRAFRRSMLLVRCERERERWSVPEGSVDVWWSDAAHGALMLLFAHMLTLNPDWRDNPVRLLHSVRSEDEQPRAEKTLTALMKLARMRVHTEIFVGEDLESDVIRVSGSAALVLLGFDPPEEGREGDWFDAHQRLLDALGETVLVYNAGDVALEA